MAATRIWSAATGPIGKRLTGGPPDGYALPMDCGSTNGRIGTSREAILSNTNWALPMRCLSTIKSTCFPARPLSSKSIWTAIPTTEKIAREFDFARVDFYEIAGEAKFGEVTFYPGSGLDPFDPPELDIAIGALWLAGSGNHTASQNVTGRWGPKAA